MKPVLSVSEPIYSIATNWQPIISNNYKIYYDELKLVDQVHSFYHINEEIMNDRENCRHLIPN